MIKIRKATEEDRKVLFLLAIEMHAESDFRHYDFKPEVAFAGIGMWLGELSNKVMFVAELDGHVIGMLAAGLINTWFGTDTTASEELFFVTKAHRGGRAGFLLMRRFCEWSEEVLANHQRAAVATGNGPAGERIYTHFGMKHVGGNFIKHLDL